MSRIEHGTPQNSTDNYKRGLAAAYWKFGIPAQGTLVEYHLRAYGYTSPIPDTIRFLPDCPDPRTGIRKPTMVAKTETPECEFAGVYLQYLDPNNIERFIDDDPDGEFTPSDLIDWDTVNQGVFFGDPQVEDRPWLSIASTFEDALVAQQNIGGVWVFDTSWSLDWSVQQLPPGIQGYSRHTGFAISTAVPDEYSNKKPKRISAYRKLICTEHGHVK